MGRIEPASVCIIVENLPVPVDLRVRCATVRHPSFIRQTPKWVAAALRPATARTWEHSGILIVDEGTSIQTLSGAQQFHRDAQTIPKAAKPLGEGNAN
jgi:hypothetical protein